MKKILFSMLLLISALHCAAEKKDDSKYLAGAVPEENGVITFRKTFSVPGHSQPETYAVIQAYIRDVLVGNAIKDLRTRVITDSQSEGVMVARVEEYMLFKRIKAFSMDRTRFRYQITATVKDNRVELVLTQVSYYYNEDQDGNNGITYKGEEWITDKEALNKKGTKLYPRSGKFRRKTVDRVEAIFEGAMDAFEQKAKESQPQKRSSVIEN